MYIKTLFNKTGLAVMLSFSLISGCSPAQSQNQTQNQTQNQDRAETIESQLEEAAATEMATSDYNRIAEQGNFAAGGSIAVNDGTWWTG